MSSRWRVYLRLGRVSNLPTVWTNVLAAAAVAGAAPSGGLVGLLIAALSFFYVGGMFLNDAFDRHADALSRPERPIPRGLVRASEVFAVGFGLLAAGVVLVSPTDPRAGVSALALAAAIVAYDAWHRNNALAPALMGLCRALVYATAALAIAGAVPLRLWLGAFALFAYVLGLTHIARFETGGRLRGLAPLAGLLAPVLVADGPPGPVSLILRAALLAWIAVTVLPVRHGRPGSVPRAVGRLIAGIAIVDAIVLADAGAPAWAAAAVLALPLTLRWQGRVPGT